MVDEKTPNERIGERIAAAIGTTGLTPLKAAKVAGVSDNTLRRWIRGEVAADAKGLAKIAEVTGVALSYLITGDTPPSKDDAVEVPVLDIEVAAGAGRSVWEAFRDGDTGESMAFPRKWLRETFGTIDTLRIVTVRGDSQLPLLSDGDQIMIDLGRTAKVDGLACVRLDDQLMVKRVHHEGRYVRLVSGNPAYEPIVVDLEADGDRFAILGRAVWRSAVLT